VEISLMWNLMIVQSLPRRPLILIGPAWRATFERMFAELPAYTPAHQRDLLYFAADATAALKALAGLG